MKYLHFIKEKLATEFKVKFYNNFESFLGINITMKNNGLELDQANYVEKLLKEYSMKNSKNISTPVVSTNTDTDFYNATSETRFPYKELVGSLQYLLTRTRPDIAFAVNYIRRFIENPLNKAICNAKRIHRCLQSTKNIP